jgi:DNA-binding MarR family transcriptional regulator
MLPTLGDPNLATFNICDEILMSIRKITRSVDLYSTKLVKKYGLTGPQMGLLKACIELKKATISELATHVSLSKPTTIAILDKLYSKKYIQREKDIIDKRKIIITPKAKALKLFQSSPQMMHDGFITNFNKLEEWEKTLMLSMLQKLSTLMNAEEIVEEIGL